MKLRNTALYSILVLMLCCMACGDVDDNTPPSDANDNANAGSDTNDEPSSAEVGTLEGEVLDHEDEPADGAFVFVGDRYYAETASDGTFSIDELPAQNYVAEAHYDDHEPGSENVAINDGETFSVTFELDEAADDSVTENQGEVDQDDGN